MSVENIQPATYVIFKDKDNAYKAKTQSGTIQFVGNNSDIVITSAIEAFASGNADKLSAGIGGVVELGPGIFDMNVSGILVGWDNVTIRGAGNFATQLRVSGNRPAIELRGTSGNPQLRNIRVENLYMTAENSGYSGSLLALRGLSGVVGSVRESEFLNLRFFDNDFKTGNAIEINHTHGPMAYLTFENIKTDGFENAFYIKAESGSAASASQNWGTSNTFRNCRLTQPYVGFKSDAISGSQFYASNFENCFIQAYANNSGALPVGHSGTFTGWFFDDNGQHTDINITNSILWDYFGSSGQSFAQVNSYTKLVCVGCSDPDISGTGMLTSPLSGGAFIYAFDKGKFTLPIPATFRDSATFQQAVNVSGIFTANTSGRFNNTVTIRKDNANLLFITRPNSNAGTGTSVNLQGQNTSGTDFTYAAIFDIIVSNVQAAEDGRMRFDVARAGTLNERMSLLNDGSLVMQSGSAQGLSGQPILRFLSGRANFSGDVQLSTTLTFASGASGISFSGMQLLPDMGTPCDAVMWISGTYRVATPADGQIIYSGSNPTSGLMVALNSLGYSTAGNARAGGTILIKKGGYNFPETIFMRSGEVNNIGNVQIIGEGRHATRLNWNSSGEDYGIFIQAGRMVFKDLTIEATSATNPALELVHMVGNGQTNTFDNVKFNGQEAGDPALSGMNGVVIAGGGNAAYYAQFRNCNFGALDIGIWLQSGFTNAAHISDCVFAIANTGVLCDGSDQNLIQNCYLQGGSSGGISCVELKGGAFFNQMSNVQAETSLSGTQTVLVGSGCHLNQVYGAINTNFNNAGTQTAIRDLASVDTSGNRTNLRNILHDSHIHPVSGITVGASPFAFTNNIGTEIQVYVGGGTVSEIRNINAHTTSGVVLSGLTQGSFTLNAGDSLLVTYSVAPGMLYKSV